ncbi:MAG: hypothetical protein MJE77_41250 [Proteobacteria bacterium]|nr:hypothetical protein [Pseudomonadota bacterium]
MSTLNPRGALQVLPPGAIALDSLATRRGSAQLDPGPIDGSFEMSDFLARGRQLADIRHFLAMETRAVKRSPGVLSRCGARTGLFRLTVLALLHLGSTPVNASEITLGLFQLFEPISELCRPGDLGASPQSP